MSDSEPAWDRAQAVVARMWVVAGLFHVWNQIPWPKEPFEPTLTRVVLELGLVLSGLLVLWRPLRVAPFLVFVLIELVHMLLDFPRIANHWLLTGLMAGAWVASASRLSARGALSPGRWLRDVVPAIRWLILVGYGAAAIAKLNRDFLDPEVSCAATTWTNIAEQWWTFLPASPAFLWMAIVVTVVVELAIPPLLLSRRGVMLGLLVGLWFHYSISVTPLLRVPDFASLLFVTFLLFAPLEVIARIGDYAAGLRVVVVRRWRLLTAVALGVLALALVPAWIVDGGVDLGAWFMRARLQAFALYGLAIIGLVLLAARPPEGATPEPVRPGGMRLGNVAHVLLVGVALLSAAQPYLGGRTVANLSMFSNLRTEDGRNNHLILPVFYLVEHQRELVRVEEASIPFLHELSTRSAALPWWELRWRAQAHPDASLTYVRDGEVHRVDRVGSDPALMAPLGVGRRWLAFRGVDEGRQSCAW